MSSKVINNGIAYLISLSVASLFVLLLSVACSPLYGPDSIVFDASVFQNIGLQWTRGHIPYQELWDHKGPLIYLFNAIGFLLTGNKAGILIPEAIAISFFIYFTFKTFRLSFPLWPSVAWTAVTVLLLAGTYAGGDNVEEIILPLLSLCFYQTQKSLVTDAYNQQPFTFGNSIWAGVALGVGLLTRLTNGAAVGGIIAGVSIFALFGKNWKRVLLYACGAVLGIVIVLLPFVLYFYLQGSFREFVSCSLGFNGSYATTMSDFPFRKYVSHVISGIPCYLLFVVSAVNLFLFKRKQSLPWILAALLTMAWWLPSRIFLKYLIVGVPFFPVLVSEVGVFVKSIGFERKIRYALFLVITLIPLTNLRFIHPFKNGEIIQLTSQLKEDIKDGDTFMTYCSDVATSAQLYLNLDVMPCYRFFYNQDSCADLSDEYKDGMIGAFKTCMAQWILLRKENPKIENILENHYHLYKEYSEVPGYKLYKRND